MARTVLLLAAFVLAACGEPGRPKQTISGSAFGTEYHVTVVDVPAERVDRLSESIVAELLRFDDVFSTWNPESELSRWNVARPGTIAASTELFDVLTRAQTLRDQTGGAFDPAVGPLVQLWNFGSRRQRSAVNAPSDAAIVEAVESMDGWSVADGCHVVKSHPATELDLSAMAKGTAVDRVGDLLRREGVTDYLVEIGGEVLAAGERPQGGPWRLQITNPQTNGPLRIVRLSGRAMATSGDYRNWQQVGGERVSHTIDPRTGRPSASRVASATVVAPTCEWADAVATAMMVLGVDEGIAWAEANDAAVLLVSRTGSGELTSRESTAFAALATPSDPAPMNARRSSD